MTNRIRKHPLWGALAVVAPAAILAALIAVGPSFAGSFLTSKQAAKTFVKRKEAQRVYLPTKTAKDEYVKKADLAPIPIVRTLASTVDVGPIYSATPFDIPGARAVFKTASTTDVVITFSGQATCAATTSGTGCPIQVMVDGSPTGTGKVNFLTSVSGSPQPKESIRTAVQSAVVGPGQHVVSVRYAGTTDTSVGLKVFDWNLIVEAYPGTDVVEEEE